MKCYGAHVCCGGWRFSWKTGGGDFVNETPEEPFFFRCCECHEVREGLWEERGGYTC